MKYFNTFAYPANETTSLHITLDDTSTIEIHLTDEELKALLDTLALTALFTKLGEVQSAGEAIRGGV